MCHFYFDKLQLTNHVRSVGNVFRQIGTDLSVLFVIPGLLAVSWQSYTLSGHYSLETQKLMKSSKSAQVKHLKK